MDHGALKSNIADPNGAIARRVSAARTSRSDAGRTRVLIIGQGPPTAGGVPTFIQGLLHDGWLRERVDFTYLNTTPPGDKEPGAFTMSNLRWTLVHAWTIFRMSRHADVVHLNLAPAPTLPLVRAALLVLAARASTPRVILHAHTGRLHTSVQRYSYRALLRVVLRLVEKFVVVSRSAERAARPCAGEKIAYIPNGVRATEFDIGPKPDSPPVLVFVGTVCERKGLLDLRDALRCLVETERLGPDRLRIQVVGDSKQEGPDAFERIVDAFAGSGLGWVEFLGAVDHDSVRRLLSAASIFCLPSHWEGFPLSLMEAMASANAAIATNVGDVPAMLADGKAGILVDPHDPAGLARAIEQLARDPRERHRLGHAARARIETTFSQTVLAERIDGLYRS